MNEQLLSQLASALTLTARSINLILSQQAGPQRPAQQATAAAEAKSAIESLMPFKAEPPAPKQVVSKWSEPVGTGRKPRKATLRRGNIELGLFLATYVESGSMAEAMEAAGIDDVSSARGLCSAHRGHIKNLRDLPIIDRRAYLAKWFGFPLTGYVNARDGARPEVVK